MRIVLFGATGMIGSGALAECLRHPDVRGVLAVGRRRTGVVHERLDEVVHDDFLDFSSAERALAGYDACLFCLGVSAAGMREADYRRITYDVTIAAAEALLAVNPDLRFCYVSAAGADPSGRSRWMWARVRGELESVLLAMPFGGAWMFRPGYVQPVGGVRSRTRLYNALYTVAGPLYPIVSRLAPSLVTTTEKVGLAMIRAARVGAPKAVLENPDINALAARERAERIPSG